MEQNLTYLIKAHAKQLGFDACGIASATCLSDEENHLSAWLKNGYNAEMGYMSNHKDKRLDPRLLVNGAKSVICLLLNYKPAEQQALGSPKIARYAFGVDYHDVIRAKLNHLLNYIQQLEPTANGRGFTDSAPVLERAWAVKAGLGWIGKNSTLISPQFGSFTFLAELIIDIELDYDEPYSSNGCGACNRCMANCPTSAICAPRTIDARQCISYQTIENKDELTVDTYNWLFGCDICLQVCPWNKRTPAHNCIDLKPLPQILDFTLMDWNNLPEDDFNCIFKHSPLKRTKFSGIKRNLQAFIQKKYIR